MVSVVTDVKRAAREKRRGRGASLPLQAEFSPAALLASIIETSEDATFSTDLDGKVTSWNAAACRMFGYAEEKMLGRPLLGIVPPEQRAKQADALRRLIDGETLARFETVRMTREGQAVEVLVTMSPVKDAAGRVAGAAHISHDITARKRMERLLIRSEKLAATGRMAATVAHEINNPLESVLNFVYLARRWRSPRRSSPITC